MKSPRNKTGKPRVAKPAPKAASQKKGANLVDPDMQRLFLVHRDAFAKAKKRMDDASNALRTLQKTIKGDGFTMSQIKDAILMSTPEGEAMVRAEIANRLLAAQYIGADVGEQLSLFMDIPRVPGVDRAAKEGTADAAANRPLDGSKYAPETSQYRAYAEAYHAEQERQVLKGIKKLDDKAGKGKPAAQPKKADGKKRGRPAKDKPGPNAKPPAGSERTLIKKADKDAKAAAAAMPDAAPPRAVPASGVAVSRSQYKAEQADKARKAKEEAESFFTKSPAAGNA